LGAIVRSATGSPTSVAEFKRTPLDGAQLHHDYGCHKLLGRARNCVRNVFGQLILWRSRRWCSSLSVTSVPTTCFSDLHVAFTVPTSTDVKIAVAPIQVTHSFKLEWFNYGNTPYGYISSVSKQSPGALRSAVSCCLCESDSHYLIQHRLRNLTRDKIFSFSCVCIAFPLL
jgi:hypothetical protein